MESQSEKCTNRPALYPKGEISRNKVGVTEVAPQPFMPNCQSKYTPRPISVDKLTKLLTSEVKIHLWCQLTNKPFIYFHYII